ncbi:MAG TPA: 30S ribosomal protein S8 [Bacteroidales bacterium]|jgi:small subunit ribosomal protein S8|nr:MAG: 30S ribosomal protein S8 [Bacteroidetes bacterium ADurb.Bin145]HQG63568.1 30S ribosomal protein S8 [Bacteroidales bacterium]
MTDPISDLLTRIRNAIMAGHKVVEAPSSKLKTELARILFEKGYILSYKVVESENKQGTLKIALKYNPKNKKPAIKTLQRASRPGLRYYSGVDDLPRVLNGLGIAIISTSRGLMTDKEAKKENIGGEVLCYVY